ncbi:MAG: tetratricopeptide repeat protein [Deltaproteobacteria bacterium]|nr:tetratricopeptide repeat protein [Deltaproteobacteria bacterium]
MVTFFSKQQISIIVTAVVFVVLFSHLFAVAGLAGEPDAEVTSGTKLYERAEALYRQANYEEAAPLYERFPSAYPNDERAATAVRMAILLYIGTDQIPKALAGMKTFEQLFGEKNKAHTASVVFSVGFVYFSTKDWTNTIGHYERYLDKYARVEQWNEIIESHAMLGEAFLNKNQPDREKALTHFVKAVALFEKHNESMTENIRKAKAMIATARAKFRIAEEEIRKLDHIKLRSFSPRKRLPQKVKKWWKKNSDIDLNIGEKYEFEQLAVIDQSLSVNPENALGALMGNDVCECFGYSGLGESKKKGTENDGIKKLKSLRPQKDRPEYRPAPSISFKQYYVSPKVIQYMYWIENEVKPWMIEYKTAMNNLVSALRKVVQMHVPEWEMAAVEKFANQQYQLANAFQSFPVAGDESLRKHLSRYWKQTAERYRQFALQTYEHCANITTKTRWYNDVSMRCFDALDELGSKKFSPLEEVLPGVLSGELFDVTDFSEKEINVSLEYGVFPYLIDVSP